MLATLHWYIFREMGKTFALTAIGLTFVLGLGGGVMNLVDLEQVTPTQLVQLMMIVLPVAGSLTLPVAALYSATAAYGRMSADNEFVACRASGINLHRLLLPPLVLSVVVASCTLYFTCFLIPGLIHRINELARADLRRFVEQRLESPDRLALPGGAIRLYADSSNPTGGDDGAIVLSGVAFLWLGEETWDRFGTAGNVVIQFGESEQGPTMSAALNNVTNVDYANNDWIDLKRQTLGPSTLPSQMRPKVKWLDLPQLLRYRRVPQKWGEIGEELAEVRAAILRDRVRARVAEQFEREGAVVLADGRRFIELRAQSLDVSAEDGGVAFNDVSLVERREGGQRTATATTAELLVAGAADDQPAEAVVRLTGNVAIRENGATLRKGREVLDGVRVDAALVAAVNDIPDSRLLDRSHAMEGSRQTQQARAHAVASSEKFVRRATSELHSRIAFSLATLVLVVLSAVLGIIFRGAHVLAAFAISFVPAMFVIVMNIMGRQLAEKAGTAQLGLTAIWGSIILVVALDVWIMARVLRR